jgi:1,4-alpha-glucan branching enzyme
VSVAGDFNAWNEMAHPMSGTADGSIWSVFVPGVQEGALYKYVIETADGR